MPAHRLEYGPLSRGIYIALICLTPLVAIVWWELLAWYLGLLAFLGLGLRPLLEKTGIYAIYQYVASTLHEWLYKDFTEKRRREIEREARRRRYRRFGPEDPRLPKKW
jgi:hypothetical protein